MSKIHDYLCKISLDMKPGTPWKSSVVGRMFRWLRCNRLQAGSNDILHSHRNQYPIFYRALKVRKSLYWKNVFHQYSFQTHSISLTRCRFFPFTAEWFQILKLFPAIKTGLWTLSFKVSRSGARQPWFYCFRATFLCYFATQMCGPQFSEQDASTKIIMYPIML